MKLNEQIELNGKEYTVELNRESIVRIEQYTNTAEASKKIGTIPIEDKSNSEILDGENPFENAIDDDAIDKEMQEKEEVIRKIITRAFWIWLYPVEKLEYKEVKEILEPYLQEDEKAKYISDYYDKFYRKSLEIRENYLTERKNLKALTK